MVILGGDQVSEVQRDRIASMIEALSEKIEANIFWCETRIGQAIAEVRDGIAAILTTSELSALQVRLELIYAQISVPGKTGLTGFDGMTFAQIMDPALTTDAQMSKASPAEQSESSAPESAEKRQTVRAQPYQCGSPFVSRKPFQNNPTKRRTSL